jgi:hypothetical protein
VGPLPLEGPKARPIPACAAGLGNPPKQDQGPTARPYRLDRAASSRVAAWVRPSCNQISHQRLQSAKPPDDPADDLPPLARRILAHLPGHVTLTLGQLVSLTGGKPGTLQLRLKELVESGYLLPKGKGRGARYVKGPRGRGG